MESTNEESRPDTSLAQHVESTFSDCLGLRQQDFTFRRLAKTIATPALYSRSDINHTNAPPAAMKTNITTAGFKGDTHSRMAPSDHRVVVAKLRQRALGPPDTAQKQRCSRAGAHGTMQSEVELFSRIRDIALRYRSTSLAARAAQARILHSTGSG